MVSSPRPIAEIDITESLVRGLLTEQHPDLAALSLEHVGSGWDNVVFRLGAQYAVRLPRRRMAARLVEHEIQWLPSLAPRLPLSVPTPLRAGTPSRHYPYSWSVVRWIPGQTMIDSPLVDQAATARTLGAFVAAMATPAPADAPLNTVRGVPLADRHTRTVERIARAVPEHLRARCLDLWAACLDAEPYAGPAVWLHGDLHPANLIVRDGALSAVIDFGDLTSGDPATDLSVAWMLFDADDRDIFRAAAGGCDEATWARARGNALAHAAACVGASSDDPVIAAVGAQTIRLLLA